MADSLTLYLRYARPVFSLAVRILPTTTAAEAVLEDVFANLWTMPTPEVTTGESVGSWLLTMTRQLALTWNEQTQNLGGYPTNQRDNDDHGDLRRTITGQAREVLPTTTGHSFIDIWAALPAIERHALELAYFHQRRPQQIADEMHVPVDMITGYIRREPAQRPMTTIDTVAEVRSSAILGRR